MLKKYTISIIILSVFSIILLSACNNSELSTDNTINDESLIMETYPIVSTASSANVHYILPSYIYKDKNELFKAFFKDFYEYVKDYKKKNYLLKDANIRNLDDFYTFVSAFSGGVKGMPQVGILLGPFFARTEIGGNIYDQTPDDGFVGYLLSKHKYEDFIKFLMKFFSDFRMDEGLTGPNVGQYIYGSDFLAYPADTVIDVAKFFHYTKKTLPKYFFSTMNIPNLYDNIPYVIKEGSEIPKDFTINYDEDGEVPVPRVIDCTNYRLEGFYTNEDYTGRRVEYIDRTLYVDENGNINLYAKFDYVATASELYKLNN